MPVLRDAPRLARLLLACFALSLGVAMVSPWVQAESLDRGWERVCTASGDELWVASGGNDTVDGTTATSHPHTLNCALCMPPLLPALGGPAPHSGQAPGHAFALPVLRQAHVPTLSRAPLPARGPPGSLAA